MVDIILALDSLDHERARGIADRRMRVRGHGAGGFQAHCPNVRLFDIVRSKEGMRGRRSPNVGTGWCRVQVSDTNAYPLGTMYLIYAFVSGT